MNIRGSIVRCLREWGYDIKDDSGSILLNDGMTIDVIRPQKYVTIDVPVFSVDTEDEEFRDLLLKTCNVLNDRIAHITHLKS